MTRRSSSVQIKSKTVTHTQARRILDDVTPKNNRPGKTYTRLIQVYSFLSTDSEGSSPVKCRTPTKEKRKIRNEYSDSDSDDEDHNEDNADLDHNDAALFHRRYFEQVTLLDYTILN